MSIKPGTKLGSYEIRSLVGAGGMGEVYRARDEDLGRDVAIKLLPANVSADPDRLRRFEQEAQAVGALNHPNILVIYHVGTHDGAPYIVSELLEGETLRDRINGAALPLRKAVDYGLQIAQGLAAAHEKGIVHRDMKPENIFITKDGRLKILDFGLAKLTQPDEGVAQTDVPTRRVNTDPGTIMGTIGYMSPEQVRGRHVDHRSDIFSFGAILYEMLSGKRAFHGESTADTMSAILREDPPDLSQTNKNVAPALERVINHCLEKNPEERFHSARDLAFAIQALSASTSISDQRIVDSLPPPKRNYREILAWGLAAILLLAAGTAIALYLRRPATEQRPMQFVVTTPEKVNEIAMPVISPDGRSIVFLGTTDGKRLLYHRPIDALSAQPLNGTEDANYPFWSPDSRFVGFFGGGKLKKLEIPGGPIQVLCDAPSPSGGTWNRDGVILFGSLTKKSILRVSAAGGESSPVTSLAEERRESEHWFPSFLPDGKHFFYYAWSGDFNQTVIYVASLDSAERKIVLKNDSNAVYVEPGYILHARGSTLLAQPFNLSTLESTGDPFPVLEDVTYHPNIGYSHFSVSETGVLVYLAGSISFRQLAWYDRAGKLISTVGDPSQFNDVVLSPDGKMAVLQRIDSASGGDLWTMDLSRGLPSRFTFSAAAEDDPAWSPDGNWIAFTVSGEGNPGIYRKSVSGTGSVETLRLSDSTSGEGIDWSKDGNFLLVPKIGQGSGIDLWIFPLDPASEPRPFLNSEFNESQGRFSPDGRWVAYVSNESGRAEVYVQGFPNGGGKLQISTAGGAQPRWRADGGELFYIAPDRKLMSVTVRSGTQGFEADAPIALFQTQVYGYLLPNRFAPSADGQRFLVNAQVEAVTQTPVTVFLNWTSTLKK